MIFLTWEQVLGLKEPAKGQTRRPVREGERCYDDRTVATAWIRESSGPVTQHYRWVPYGIKWQVGRTYAVQPGRGKAAVWWRPDGTATPTPLEEYVRRNHQSSTRALWGPKVKAWLHDHGYREARIEVKKIRRESLQDISEEDCIAEGVQVRSLYGMDYIPTHHSLGDERYWTEDQRIGGFRGAFAQMWDNIYWTDCRWLENPKVWVLDFEMERSEA